MENKKRMRATNWDEEEKRILRQLVMDKIDIIENKNTDTNTNTKKKVAWQEIWYSFNNLNNKPRDMAQLLTQWRNMKWHIKSRELAYRHARNMTGEGSPPPSPPQEDIKIIEAIPIEFEADSNSFDSDSLYQKLKSNNQITSPCIAETKCSLPSPTTPTTSPKNKSINRKLNKLTKMKNTMVNNYEHQLFLLAKRSKDNMEKREDELHRKRMIILDLEQKYWEKKICKLDT